MLTCIPVEVNWRWNIVVVSLWLIESEYLKEIWFLSIISNLIKFWEFPQKIVILDGSLNFWRNGDLKSYCIVTQIKSMHVPILYIYRRIQYISLTGPVLTVIWSFVD